MQNRDQIILNIKKDFSQSSRVKSVLSSVESSVLSEQGIDLKLFTDKGTLSFRVRVSQYKAGNMFIKTASANGHDGLFDTQADFIIQIYKDRAVIYETKPLIDYLKKVLPSLPGIPANGRYINSDSCIGKLVSLKMIELTNMNYMKFELTDLIDKKYASLKLTDNVVKLKFSTPHKKEDLNLIKSCPSKFKEFMEKRRKSKNIVNDVINKINKPDLNAN